MHKIRFQPAGGGYRAPSDPLAEMGGEKRGRGGKGYRRGGKEKERRGEGKGRGREGKG